jgi:hypothetical protein
MQRHQGKGGYQRSATPNPNARARIRDFDLSRPVQESDLRRSGGPLPDWQATAPGYPICGDFQWLKEPNCPCRASAIGAIGCRYAHICGFIGLDGEPCQNPFPCRLFVHYEEEWYATGGPPLWYQRA